MHMIRLCWMNFKLITFITGFFCWSICCLYLHYMHMGCTVGAEKRSIPYAPKVVCYKLYIHACTLIYDRLCCKADFPRARSNHPSRYPRRRSRRRGLQRQRSSTSLHGGDQRIPRALAFDPSDGHAAENDQTPVHVRPSCQSQVE